MDRDAKKLGLTVLRTWAFADGSQWNAIQPSLGILDERVLSGVRFDPTSNSGKKKYHLLKLSRCHTLKDPDVSQSGRTVSGHASSRIDMIEGAIACML